VVQVVVRSTTRDHNEKVTKVFEPSATKSPNGTRDGTNPATHANADERPTPRTN
jgi:hypothetical protein